MAKRGNTTRAEINEAKPTTSANIKLILNAGKKSAPVPTAMPIATASPAVAQTSAQNSANRPCGTDLVRRGDSTPTGRAVSSIDVMRPPVKRRSWYPTPAREDTPAGVLFEPPPAVPGGGTAKRIHNR